MGAGVRLEPRQAPPDARVLPLPHSANVSVLPPRAVERIHAGTMRVLEEVGVEVRSDALVTALGLAGAHTDPETRRVFFPESVVRDALALAPRELLLAARDPACDLVLDGKDGYLTVDGNAAEILDLDTDERRASTKDDLAQVSRVADALPQIGFLWQAVAARDTPIETQPLHELHAQFANTSKHIQLMTAVNTEQARSAVQMANIVAGGQRELRERPVLSAFQCSLSPLTYDGGPLEAATVYAEAGVPCGFVAMPIACATAPATPGGTLVTSNAEVLAGIVALQLLVPGARTFYGACGTVMDLRSGAAACGGPEDLFFQAASAQLARNYGLPSSIGTFATGAKSAGWQAGVENGLSVTASWLGGADMLCGAGLLYGARVYSIVELLLDAELFDYLRVIASGFAVTEEDLALEVIEAVNRGGHSLATAHARANIRRRGQSQSFGRETWEDWETGGRPDPRTRAKERARQILEEHEPMPLAAGVLDDIEGVIAEHEHR